MGELERGKAKVLCVKIKRFVGGGETLALWCKIDECLKNSCQTRVFLVFFALFYS